MKINIGVIGKFHLFDLARELLAKNVLGDIYTAYPTFKLNKEKIPLNKIHTFPYVHTLYMTKISRMVPVEIRREWERVNSVTFESFVARSISECDVFVGISGSALKPGRRVKSLGGRYVCDRGSAHIRFQNKILTEEFDIVGMKFLGIDPRVIAQEEEEYEAADMITVPSAFNVATFNDYSVPIKKIRKLPYGVNLNRFYPTGNPPEGMFNVVFVGSLTPGKGVHYLIDAFDRLVADNKMLHLVGVPNEKFLALLKRRASWGNNIRVYGHVPQVRLKEIMSSSHVMVHPSVQEGLAMVQAQAMACACPVIATENTGSIDLFEDGVEGFIVPIRSVDAIVERLQRFADDRTLRDQMGQKALAKVKKIGGWKEYGDGALAIYRNLIEGKQ